MIQKEYMGIQDMNTLETERLYLRELSPEVYEMIFRDFPDLDLMDFFGFTELSDLIREKQRYREGLKSYNKSFVTFHMIDKTGHTIIGSCGFHTWYLQHRRAEIGYAINEESNKNMGFMKEALRAVITYGFEQMDLNRIEAFVGPDNIPSNKLMQGFGFKEEGRMREHYIKDGVISDSLVYGLLRNEFTSFD